MTVGQRIAQKRKELGLSQEGLGDKLGVSRQAIYKWESDASLPEVEKLVALSRIFSVPVGWLLGEEEHPAGQADGQSAELTEAQIKMVQEIADRAAVDTLIIFGGDTLAAVIRRMGIQSLQPVAQPAKGVVLCQVEYRGRSLRLITKSGGFGGENLVEIIQTALTPAPDLSKSSTCKKE